MGSHAAARVDAEMDTAIVRQARAAEGRGEYVGNRGVCHPKRADVEPRPDRASLATVPA